MENPFNSNYQETEDRKLIESALSGSQESLEALIKRHQHYIYNVSIKMVLSPYDAEDITQEVLIKMVTKLSQFKGKSNFRTWLYRITFNHMLKAKKNFLEEGITSFEGYGNDLDSIEDVDLTEEQKIEQSELIKEAKFGCMMGMLLCLDRDQRLVYILAEIFEADHSIGSELLDISKANFRKKLERARRDLYKFMNNKCGLLNTSNPCRCSRKTLGFIKAGWVDKEKMKFNTEYVESISLAIERKNDALNNSLENDYAKLFSDTPFQEKKHHKALMERITVDKNIKEVFNLN